MTNYRGSSFSAVSKSADFAIVRFWKLSKSSNSTGEFHYCAFFSKRQVKKIEKKHIFQKAIS